MSNNDAPVAPGSGPSPSPATDPAAPVPAQATVVPSPPSYITTKTPAKKLFPPPKKGEPPNPDPPADADPIQWNGNEIQLYTLSFLGRPFSPGKGFTIPMGVNVDLAKRLIAAQTTLYWKALAEAQQADPAVKELSEPAFAKWCWSYQEPMREGVSTPGGVQGSLGYKDVGSLGSFHASGSAVDLNLFFNPYVPNRSATHIGGEAQDYAKDFFKSHPELAGPKGAAGRHQLQIDLIWGPVLEVFDRAYSLGYGTGADLSPNGSTANAAANYQRFKTLSLSVQAYFRYAYNDGDSTPRSQGEFETIFSGDVNDPQGLIDPNATFAGQNLRAGLASNRAATLAAVYNQIVEDYRTFQIGCVQGKVTINADKSLILPPKQRDPCKGIFNVRREVFMELVQEQKLRWGGCMFGDGSGDMMHFDLGAHWVDGVQV